MVLLHCAKKDNIKSYKHNFTFVSSETAKYLHQQCTLGVQQISELFRILINTDDQQTRKLEDTTQADLLLLKEARVQCYNDTYTHRISTLNRDVVAYNQRSLRPHRLIEDLMYLLVRTQPHYRLYNIVRDIATVELERAALLYPDDCFAEQYFLHDFIEMLQNAHSNSLLMRFNCIGKFNVLNILVTREYKALPYIELKIKLLKYSGTLKTHTLPLRNICTISISTHMVVGRYEDYISQLWHGTYATYNGMRYNHIIQSFFVNNSKHKQQTQEVVLASQNCDRYMYGYHIHDAAVPYDVLSPVCYTVPNIVFDSDVYRLMYMLNPEVHNGTNDSYTSVYHKSTKTKTMLIERSYNVYIYSIVLLCLCFVAGGIFYLFKESCNYIKKLRKRAKLTMKLRRGMVISETRVKREKRKKHIRKLAHSKLKTNVTSERKEKCDGFMVQKARKTVS